MGFITKDIGRVPSEGYDWYITLLEDEWRDDLRDTLEKNFEVLSKKTGKDTLVVKGIEPTDFFPSEQKLETSEQWEKSHPHHKVVHNNVLKPNQDLNDTPNDDPDYNWNVPAFVISNVPPDRIRWGIIGDDDRQKIIFIPLSEYDQSIHRLGDFLQRLVNTLRDPEALEALESKDEAVAENKWLWLNDMITLKPNFYGFGLDINSIIDDSFNRS